MSDITHAVINGLSNIRSVEQYSSLLERFALGFHDHEVTEGQLKHEPDAVYDLQRRYCQLTCYIRANTKTYIVFPSNIAESNGVNVLIEDKGA